jgi:hypothetical protein
MNDEPRPCEIAPIEALNILTRYECFYDASPVLNAKNCVAHHNGKAIHGIQVTIDDTIHVFWDCFKVHGCFLFLGLDQLRIDVYLPRRRATAQDLEDCFEC